MTLRGEIAALKHPENGNGVSQMLSNQHNSAIDAVLAIIDSYTANGIPLLSFGAVADDPVKNAPASEERRCRGFLEARIDWNLTHTFDPGFAEALAIIEAIDANTAAIREAKQ